jgi:hypothetical protein
MITFPFLARVIDREDDVSHDVLGTYLIQRPQDLHSVAVDHRLLLQWTPRPETPQPSLDAYLRRVHKISEHDLAQLKPDAVWKNSRFSALANSCDGFIAQQQRIFDKSRADNDSETGKAATTTRLLNRLMVGMRNGCIDATAEFKDVAEGNSVLGCLLSSVKLEITEFDTIRPMVQSDAS